MRSACLPACLLAYLPAYLLACLPEARSRTVGCGLAWGGSTRIHHEVDDCASWEIGRGVVRASAGGALCVSGSAGCPGGRRMGRKMRIYASGKIVTSFRRDSLGVAGQLGEG